MRPPVAIAFVAAALLALPAGAAHGATYRGKLEIRHSDDFAHERTHTRYRLVNGRHRTPLVLARAPRTPSGSDVVVRGRRTGSRIRGTVSPSGLVRAAAVPAGQRKTAVILINFTADQTVPFSMDAARQAVFTGPSSANSFYTGESYGDVSLIGKVRADGDVFGWYTLATPRDTCAVNTWATQAKAAAALAGGFAPSDYAHVVYMFPKQPSCGGWAGLAEMPGRQAWINGTLSPRVIAHELGHNMGVNHASSLSCTSAGVPTAFPGICIPDEYGDPFDVMGKNLRHNNAWHMRQIGFMSAANVNTTSANGTYTLTSAISKGSGTQLLRVPRAGSKLYYDLELRSSGGVFDNYLSTDPAVQGVTIHIDPDVQTIEPSLLIDTTPGSSAGFYDAPLAPGRTFSDGVVSISVQSVSGTSATVSVATAPPPPDTTPPAPPQPVAAPTVDHVALQWTASTDDVGVAGYRVYRDGGLMATVTATAWTDASVTAGTTYSYTVAAYDAAGNVATSTPVTATVPRPQPATTPVDPPLNPPAIPVDRTRPTVRVVSPARDARLRRRAVVRVAAADNTKVVRTELWVDGKLRKTAANGKVAWPWLLRRTRPGRHRIAVRAFDAAGNQGSRSVRVYVLR